MNTWCLPESACLNVVKHRPSEGLFLAPQVLGEDQLEGCKAKIDRAYHELAKTPGQKNAFLTLSLPDGERFQPTASSFTVGAIFSQQELRRLLSSIMSEPVGSWITENLLGSLVCDLDQSWVRRQFAPGRYPVFHAPHGWHQDGALGFDFRAHPSGRFPAEGMLRMVTCWVALDPCGEDAPGLELVCPPMDGLLAPSQLLDQGVRALFRKDQFCRPVLEPGDALLFRGDILHRTHVSQEMTKDRTSVELRFFPANQIPSRLKEDRFFRMD